MVRPLFRFPVSARGKPVYQHLFINIRPIVRPAHGQRLSKGPRARTGCREGRAIGVLLALMVSAMHGSPMLPDEQTGSEQIAVLRAMSGQERLRLAERLYWSARKMKAAGVRAQHPDWLEERVDDEVRRIFSNARS